jgi:hypothetical protein
MHLHCVPDEAVVGDSLVLASGLFANSAGNVVTSHLEQTAYFAAACPDQEYLLRTLKGSNTGDMKSEPAQCLGRARGKPSRSLPTVPRVRFPIVF